MTMPPMQGSAPPVLVGVDVGGTKVAVLVADQQRHVLAHTRQPTDVIHPERTLASIASAIQQSLSLAGVSLRDGAAVGYVSIGTGIAAGLILNGQLYRGAHGRAGEIGHIMVDPEGPLCSCGARGCLESVAAGAGDGVEQAIVDKVGLYLGRTFVRLF